MDNCQLGCGAGVLRTQENFYPRIRHARRDAEYPAGFMGCMTVGAGPRPARGPNAGGFGTRPYEQTVGDAAHFCPVPLIVNYQLFIVN